MADMKKEQEREELHRAIWAIADELRGAVDGWDFKNYVLGTMFYRYISENLCNYINEGEIAAGNTDFDYAQMSDEEAEQARAGLVQEKGFFILPSELFANVLKRAAKDENLNETLERIFNHIEESARGSESENSFAGLFDDYDVNSNKLGSTVAKRNEKLVKLLEGVAAMNLGDVKHHDIDAFGDAYEYLMTMYASNAGKSGGEFFTPADVSELLTRLGTVDKTEINKVYDPACGSGSLLLKAEKVLGKDAVRNGFFGQEINITTYNLCRINMFLHDVGFDKFNIACEDTLISPQHWDDEPFELIVSNPPYSIKWAGDDNPLLINDPRFAPAGVLAPKFKADLAFIMHALSWLSSNGTAAIVCFPGIMYRGGAEQKIRKYLIDNNFVDCVIQLPSNLFFGTSIATCIMVLKKGKADNRVLFIDATNECIKVTNNNKLTPENIARMESGLAGTERSWKSALEGLQIETGEIFAGLKQTALTELTGIVRELTQGLSEANGDWDKIGESVGVAIESILSTIGSYLPTIVNMAVGIISALVTGLTENIDQVVSVASQIEKIKDKFKDVVNAIIDTVKRLFGINSPSTVFAGFGKNLIAGLWNGINDMVSWVLDKVRDFGNKLIDAVKKVFGIASPSRVFADQIGKNLGLGVGVGFEDAMKDVSEDMANAIPTDFDVSANVRGTPDYAQAGGSISLVLNIENFHNYRSEDINELADELSVILAAKMNRKAAAF